LSRKRTQRAQKTEPKPNIQHSTPNIEPQTGAAPRTPKVFNHEIPKGMDTGRNRNWGRATAEQSTARYGEKHFYTNWGGGTGTEQFRAFLKRHGASGERRRTLLDPDPSARGLAQSKTLARMTMVIENAKRFGRRWPSTAFSPRRVFSTAFRQQNRYMILGNALAARERRELIENCSRENRGFDLNHSALLFALSAFFCG
jgi:hypothetical protein